MNFKRVHYINILENIYKHLILLIFPILRGIFSYKQGFVEWFKGTWFDLVVIILIVAIGLIKWASFRYMVTKKGIFIKKGLLLKIDKFVAFKDISSLTLEKPFYYKPIDAVRLDADTDCGSKRVSDVYLILKEQDCMEIASNISKNLVKNNNIKRSYSPSILHITLLSIITSNSLSGVIFISTLTLHLGNLIGLEFQDQIVNQITSMAQAFAVGISPTTALIAYLIILGWVISFISNILRHKGFTVSRCNENINIKSGVFTKRSYFFATKKINLVEIKQSLITKLLGFFSIFIHISGYGKKKDELSILIPCTSKKNISTNISMLLPSVQIKKKQIKPLGRYFTKFITTPFWNIVLVLALFVALYYIYPGFENTIAFLGIMFQIPFVWILIIKIIAFFHTGIAKDDNDVYTFYTTRIYSIYTVILPKEKITKIDIRQNIFQILDNCCDVIIFSYSEGKKKTTLKNLQMDQVYDILSINH